MENEQESVLISKEQLWSMQSIILSLDNEVQDLQGQIKSLKSKQMMYTVQPDGLQLSISQTIKKLNNELRDQFLFIKQQFSDFHDQIDSLKNFFITVYDRADDGQEKNMRDCKARKRQIKVGIKELMEKVNQRTCNLNLSGIQSHREIPKSVSQNLEVIDKVLAIPENNPQQRVLANEDRHYLQQIRIQVKKQVENYYQEKQISRSIKKERLIKKFAREQLEYFCRLCKYHLEHIDCIAEYHNSLKNQRFAQYQQSCEAEGPDFMIGEQNIVISRNWEGDFEQEKQRFISKVQQFKGAIRANWNNVKEKLADQRNVEGKLADHGQGIFGDHRNFCQEEFQRKYKTSKNELIQLLSKGSKEAFEMKMDLLSFQQQRQIDQNGIAYRYEDLLQGTPKLGQKLRVQQGHPVNGYLALKVMISTMKNLHQELDMKEINSIWQVLEKDLGVLQRRGR